jgi:hypothetical protein
VDALLVTFSQWIGYTLREGIWIACAGNVLALITAISTLVGIHRANPRRHDLSFGVLLFAAIGSAMLIGHNALLGVVIVMQFAAVLVRNASGLRVLPHMAYTTPLRGVADRLVAGPGERWCLDHLRDHTSRPSHSCGLPNCHGDISARARIRVLITSGVQGRRVKRLPWGPLELQAEQCLLDDRCDE